MFGCRSWHFVAGLLVAAPFLLPYLQGQFSLAEPSEVGVGRSRGWGQVLGGGSERQTILLAAPNWVSCNCTLRNLRHHLCGNNVPWNNLRWPQILSGCKSLPWRLWNVTLRSPLGGRDTQPRWLHDPVTSSPAVFVVGAHLHPQSTGDTTSPVTQSHKNPSGFCCYTWRHNITLAYWPLTPSHRMSSADVVGLLH